MAMSTEDRLAAQRVKAAAIAARQAVVAAAALPSATPLDLFLAQSGFPPAPPMHSRLYDIEFTPEYLAWETSYGIRIKAAEANARANSPEWRAVVAAYNTGGTIPPAYWTLLNRLRLYYTDGAANPGKLAPETAAQALTRWAADAAPSAIEGAIVAAVPVALKVAAIAAGADIVAGGTLFSAGAASSTSAATASQAASIVTPQAVAPVAIDTGVTAAMETAAQLSAATSHGVASAATAIAEVNAAQWATLATGNVVSQSALVADILQNIPKQPPTAPTAPTAPTVPPAPPAPPVTPSPTNAIIESMTGTATKAGGALVSQAINKAITPKPVAPAKPQVQKVDSVAGLNIGIIVAALATVAAVVSFA